VGGGAGAVPPADAGRALLLAAWEAALASVDPGRRLPPILPPPDDRPVRVLAAGKAAAAQLRAFTAAWPVPVTGLLVTPRGASTGPVPAGIQWCPAGHPVPDAGSEHAARLALALARDAGPDDRLVVLLSGGASALLAAPLPGITLADKQELTRRLLAAGLDIHGINGVRRKLSAVKGGRLARSFGGAELWLFALSDVPGDVLADIGSGPCAPDPVPLAEARRMLDEAGVMAPPSVAAHLAGPAAEPVPADDPCFQRVRGALIGRPADALAAAAGALAAAGWPVTLLGEATGPTLDLARTHAGLAAATLARGERRAFVSGGETTHRVAGAGGRGGRNTAYLLGLALALPRGADLVALSADTDGIDGSGGHAGAFLGSDTLDRARAAGVDPAAALAVDDSARVFAAAGDLFVPGPTGTNVNDLRILLVRPQGHRPAMG
jgi:hydroxypyruvate reductase